jgi:hypothetical protein
MISKLNSGSDPNSIIQCSQPVCVLFAATERAVFLTEKAQKPKIAHR